MYLWYRLINRLGTLKCWRIALAWLGLSLVPMYFVHSLLPACLAGVLVGVGIAGVTANLDMVNSVLIEDDAARYGVRREATFFAGISFITRLSSLTRSGVFLLLFTLFGFESGESPGAMPGTAARFMMIVFPIALMAFSVCAPLCLCASALPPPEPQSPRQSCSPSAARRFAYFRAALFLRSFSPAGKYGTMPARRGSGALGPPGERGNGAWTIRSSSRCGTMLPPAGEFFALARRVFGLSFEEWHRAGWWTDRYVPYTMVYRDGSAAANVSVNRIDTVWRGEALRLVQLGTVMTAPAHRGKGPCPQSDGSRTGRLGPHLRRRLSLCQRHGAGVYPKFGFVPRAGNMSAHCRCPPSHRSAEGGLRGWTWTRRPGARCCCAAMSAPTLSPLCPCWITPAC